MRCVEQVFDGWHHHQCSRNAVKDGYCRQHHPDAVAERERKRKERQEAERAKSPYRLIERMGAKLRELMGDTEYEKWRKG